MRGSPQNRLHETPLLCVNRPSRPRIRMTRKVSRQAAKTSVDSDFFASWRLCERNFLPNHKVTVRVACSKFGIGSQSPMRSSCLENLSLVNFGFPIIGLSGMPASGPSENVAGNRVTKSTRASCGRRLSVMRSLCCDPRRVDVAAKD